MTFFDMWYHAFIIQTFNNACLHYKFKIFFGNKLPPPPTHTQYLENVDYFLNADRDQTLENYSPQW